MKKKPKNGILIAFGELFLKSPDVKKLFIKKLAWNLQHFLKKAEVKAKVHVLYDRIFVETEDKEAKNILQNIFGVSWFTDALFFEEADLKSAQGYINTNWEKKIGKKETYALRVKIDSSFGSRENVIEKLAEKIDRKVDLSNPDREIFIESKKGNLFIYFKKEKGAGGFPSACGENILTLVSGGIDSPVASYLMAKRGANNIWLHFHSFPLVSNKSIEKVKETAKVFVNFQQSLKIYFVPFQKAQIEIKSKIPAEYRVLLYRRLMFRIAEKIAEKENCYALSTGESLGQVSSQTLPNMNIIEEVVKIPVLRPLIGMDKEEIIEIAKKIGTFDISIKPQEDCCTLFVPKHSCAKGDIKKAREMEKMIDVEKIIGEAIEGIKTENC